jgi:hypothetical protein
MLSRTLHMSIQIFLLPMFVEYLSLPLFALRAQALSFTPCEARVKRLVLLIAQNVVVNLDR